METIEVIASIAKHHPEIQSFQFYEFPKQMMLEERIAMGVNEEQQYKQALRIREEFHVPFWDCLMITQFNNSNSSDSLLDAAKMHNFNRHPIVIDNDLYLFDKLQQLKLRHIGWNSTVVLQNGSVMHIPMIDFHIPVSDANLRVVINTLRKLSLDKGYILNSGESYHYIHFTYVPFENLRTILINTLFFSPIVDRLWVAHQLLNDSAMLRIGLKHGAYPFVVLNISGNE